MTRRRLLAALFPCVVSAQTPFVSIDCGSASDSNFVGGAVSTILNPPPGLEDVTARYGNFFYLIPVDNVPYLLTFHWVENTVKSAGQRLFQVKVNDQVIFDRLDLFVLCKGFQKAASRSVVVCGADELLKVEFVTQVRNAICSAIDVTPLFQILGSR